MDLNSEHNQQQVESLNEQIRELLDQQKPLSRQIGQAKAAKQPVEQLVNEMRKLSSRVKVLTDDRDKLLASVLDKAPVAKTVEAGKPLYFQVKSESESQESLNVIIELCEDGKRWDEYIAKHIARTSYHYYGFIELVRTLHGLTVYPLAAKNNADEYCGVLPIVHLKSKLFGSFLVSLPYVNYGGVLSDSDEIASRLMDSSRILAKHLGCSHTEIRETHQRSGWFCRQHKASMTRALPATDEIFDKEIGTKLRAQTRKAISHGAEFRTGGKELVADFYSVFSTNMRDLGTPIYKVSFFSKLLDLLGDDAFIAVTYIDNKPVATGFLISHGKTLEIPWASCLRRANQFDANMFLYRNILREAINRKFEFFDFGRSTIDGPTYRFKKQWGAVPQKLYWHYWLSDPNDQPGLNPDNPKFRLVIAVWRKLPVTLTRIIGPPIAKHLP